MLSTNELLQEESSIVRWPASVIGAYTCRHPHNAVQRLRCKRTFPSTNMAPVLFIQVAAVTAAAGLVWGQEESYTCDLPAAGCRFGIFNQVKCTCECIPPFCPDAAAECSTATTCDNPWENCVRGIDCPWWKNDANAEACTTGPTVRNESFFGFRCRCNYLNDPTNIILDRFRQVFGKSITLKSSAAKLTSPTLKFVMSRKEASLLPSIPHSLLRRMTLKSFPSDSMSLACHRMLSWRTSGKN